MQDKNFFSLALSLAQGAKGYTSPNPAVGCVIVKNNHIIGQGATQPWGKSHAEIVALQQAGKKARGATVYVTLEPCVWYAGKRTPSCTDALIAAGVTKVYIGSLDPNPAVKGKGIEKLRQAGIEVVMANDFHREILDLNQDFSKYIQTGLPYVIGKYAMTLDGQIATHQGDSHWITSEEARTRVHILRSQVDAIMVGIGTILADNPRLTARLPSPCHQPLRIVLDPYAKTPPEAHVRSDGHPSLFITLPGFGKNFAEENVSVWEMGKEPSIPMREVFARLGQEKHITSILVEGGGRVLYRCLKEDTIDKLLVFIGGKIIGGRGIPPFNGKGAAKLADTPVVQRFYAENLGRDVMIQAYLKMWDV
ncbi:MAG: bifunctional diaminohydroxyphosphoribosylaminopyrimidine deaminase/5-amino-6-(5-phosphoribosylamino)uracil reductase RibD [Brevinematales bacterium]|nr:bifunctional diaminohydroxyphosphoribosylaminopyrimidine deaminase/5-amino-6-(5-phosphoribosylamino)uracil reductase RibD [Brevinematales bacterium]